MSLEEREDAELYNAWDVHDAQIEDTGDWMEEFADPVLGDFMPMADAEPDREPEPASPPRKKLRIEGFNANIRSGQNPPGTTGRTIQELEAQIRQIQADKERRLNDLAAQLAASILDYDPAWTDYPGIGEKTAKVLQGYVFPQDVIADWFASGQDLDRFAQRLGTTNQLAGRIVRYVIEPTMRQHLDSELEARLAWQEKLSADAAKYRQSILDDLNTKHDWPVGTVLYSYDVPWPTGLGDPYAMGRDWERQQRLFGHMQEVEPGIERTRREGVRWIDPGKVMLEREGREPISLRAMLLEKQRQYNNVMAAEFKKMSKEERAGRKPKRMELDFGARDAEGRPVYRTSYIDHDGTVETYEFRAVKSLSWDDQQAQIFVNNAENASGGFMLNDRILLNEIDDIGRAQRSFDEWGHLIVDKEGNIPGAKIRKSGDILWDALFHPRQKTDYGNPNITDEISKEREQWQNFSQITEAWLAYNAHSIVRPKEKRWQDADNEWQEGVIYSSENTSIMSWARRVTGRALGGRGDEGSYRDLRQYARTVIPRDRLVPTVTASGETVYIPNMGDDSYLKLNSKRARLWAETRGASPLLRIAPGTTAPSMRQNATIGGGAMPMTAARARARFYLGGNVLPEGTTLVHEGRYLAAVDTEYFLPEKTPDELRERYKLQAGQVYFFNGYRPQDMQAWTRNDTAVLDASTIPGLPRFNTGNIFAARIDDLVYDERRKGTRVRVARLMPIQETEIKTGHKGMAQGVVDNPLLPTNIDMAMQFPSIKDALQTVMQYWQSQSPEAIREQYVNALTQERQEFVDPGTMEVLSPGGFMINPATGKRWTREDALASIRYRDLRTGEFVVKDAYSPEELADRNRFVMDLNLTGAEQASMQWFFSQIKEEIFSIPLAEHQVEMIRAQEQERRAAYISSLQEKRGLSEEEAIAQADSAAGRRVWGIFEGDPQKQMWRGPDGRQLINSTTGEELYTYTANVRMPYVDVDGGMFGVLQTTTTGQTRMTAELLDQLFETEEGAAENIVKRYERGEFYNPSLNMVLARRMNNLTADGELTDTAQRMRAEANILNLDDAESAKAFYGAYAEARKLAAESEEKDDAKLRLAVRYLSQDDRFAGRFIQMGGAILPSIDTISNYLSLTSEDDLIKNEGLTLLSAVHAQERVAMADPTNPKINALREYRDEQVGVALSELWEFTDSAEVQKKAAELLIEGTTGPARGAPIPEGVEVIKDRRLAEILRGVSDDTIRDTMRGRFGEDYNPRENESWRDALWREARAGMDLTGFAVMFPGAKPEDYLRVKSVFLESVVAPYLGGYRATAKGALQNMMDTAIADKDHDADTRSGWINFGSRQQLTGLSKSERAFLAQTAPSGEIASIIEKARDLAGNAFMALLDPDYRLREMRQNFAKFMGSHDESRESKQAMGQEYNPLIRQYDQFVRMVTRSGGESRVQRRFERRASGQIAASNYQMAIDLAQSKDPGFRFFNDIFHGLRVYTNPRDASTPSPWLPPRDDRPGETLTERYGGSPIESDEQLSNYIMERIVRMGMRHHGVVTADMSDEEAIALHQQNMDAYRRDVWAWAQSITPQHRHADADYMWGVQKWLLNIADKDYDQPIDWNEFEAVVGYTPFQLMHGVEGKDTPDNKLALLPTFIASQIYARSMSAYDKARREAAEKAERKGETYDWTKDPRQAPMRDNYALIPDGPAKRWAQRLRETTHKTLGVYKRRVGVEKGIAEGEAIGEISEGANRGLGFFSRIMGGADTLVGRKREEQPPAPEPQAQPSVATQQQPPPVATQQQPPPVAAPQPPQAPPPQAPPPQADPLPPLLDPYDDIAYSDYNAPDPDYGRDELDVLFGRKSGELPPRRPSLTDLPPTAPPPVAGDGSGGDGGGRPPVATSTPWDGDDDKRRDPMYIETDNLHATIFFATMPRSTEAIDRAILAYKRLREFADRAQESGVPDVKDISPKLFSALNNLRGVYSAMMRRQHDMQRQDDPDYHGPTMYETDEDKYFVAKFLDPNNPDGIHYERLMQDLANLGLTAGSGENGGVGLITQAYDENYYGLRKNEPLGPREIRELQNAASFLQDMGRNRLIDLSNALNESMVNAGYLNTPIIPHELDQRAQRTLSAVETLRDFRERLRDRVNLGIATDEDLEQLNYIGGILGGEGFGPAMFDERDFEVLEDYEDAVKSKRVERGRKPRVFKPLGIEELRALKGQMGYLAAITDEQRQSLLDAAETGVITPEQRDVAKAVKQAIKDVGRVDERVRTLASMGQADDELVQTLDQLKESMPNLLEIAEIADQVSRREVRVSPAKTLSKEELGRLRDALIIIGTTDQAGITELAARMSAGERDEHGRIIHRTPDVQRARGLSQAHRDVLDLAQRLDATIKADPDNEQAKAILDLMNTMGELPDVSALNKQLNLERYGAAVKLSEARKPKPPTWELADERKTRDALNTLRISFWGSGLDDPQFRFADIDLLLDVAKDAKEGGRVSDADARRIAQVVQAYDVARQQQQKLGEIKDAGGTLTPEQEAFLRTGNGLDYMDESINVLRPLADAKRRGDLITMAKRLDPLVARERSFRQTTEADYAYRYAASADELAKATGIRVQRGDRAGSVVESVEELTDALNELNSVSKNNVKTINSLIKAYDAMEVSYRKLEEGRAKAEADRDKTGGKYIPNADQANALAAVLALGGGDEEKGAQVLRERLARLIGVQQSIESGMLDVVDDLPDDTPWSVLTMRGKRGEEMRKRYLEAGRMDEALPEWANAAFGRLGITPSGGAMAVGAVARSAADFFQPSTLWALRMTQNMFIKPGTRAADDYMQRQAAIGQAAFGTGRISYDDFIESTGGEFMRRLTKRDLGKQAFGEQAYQVYGPLMDAFTGPNMRGNVLTTAATIGGPAAGVGYMLSRVAPLARFSLPAAALVAGGLTYSYMASNTSNFEAIGEASGQILPLIFNTSGTAGLIGGMPKALWSAISGGIKYIFTGDDEGLDYARKWSNSHALSEAIDKLSKGEDIDRVLGQNASGLTIEDIYGRGTVLSGALNKWLKRVQEDYGVSHEAALNVFSTYSAAHTISQQYLPNQEQTKQILALVSAGVDLQGLLSAQMQAYNVLPTDYSGIAGLYEGTTERLSQASNPVKEAREITFGAQVVAPINPNRQLLGWELLDDTWATQFQSAAELTANQQFQAWYTNATIQDPLYEFGLKAMRVSDLLATGDILGATRLMNTPDLTAIGTSWGMSSDLGGGGLWGRDAMDILQFTLEDMPQYKALGDGFLGSIASFLGQTGRAGLKSFGDTVDPERYIRAMGELQTHGISLEQLNAVMTRRAREKLGGRTPLYSDIQETSALFLDELEAGTYDIEALQTEALTGEAFGSIDTARRISGRGTLGYSDTMAQKMLDPVWATAFQTIEGIENQMAARQTGLHGMLGGMFSRLGQWADTDPAIAMRMAGQASQINALWERGVMYGGDRQGLASSLARLPFLSTEDYNLAMAIGSGDRYAISQNWEGLGSKRFQTIDMETGLDAYQLGIDSVEYANILDNARRRGRENWMLKPTDRDYDALELGTSGIENRIRDIQLGERQRERAFQIWQRDSNWLYQTGGATSLDGQGFAQGGGLQALAELMSQAGVAFNAGNGMGIWQLQDWQTRLQREQQLFSYEQQGQQLALQREEFGIQGERFWEQQSLKRERAEWSEERQGEQIQRGRQQMTMQFQWQEEDLAYSRNMNELQFGWQMQDLDLALRYSQGRERRQLLRQRDRAVISHSMQMGQLDREEDRLDQRRKWAEAEQKLQEENHKKTVEWRKEDMALTERYFTRDRALQEQRMRMSEEAHRRQQSWMQQSWQIEDQRRLIERQIAQAQYNMTVKMQDAAYLASERVRVLQENLGLANTALSDVNSEIGLLSTNLSLLDNWLKNSGSTAPGAYSGGGGGTGNWHPQPMGIYTSSQGRPTTPPKGYTFEHGMWGQTQYPGVWQWYRTFDKGGHTGEGAPWEVAGIVHKREYVVPEGGSLVLRGHSADTDLLKQILEILRRMSERGLAKILLNYQGQDLSRAFPGVGDMLDRVQQEM